MIEREIPGVGRLDRAQLRKIAAKSNGVLAGLSGKVQWLDSFVAADKTFCVYLAESEDLVLRTHGWAAFRSRSLRKFPPSLVP
jgi:hypothetical protein